MSYEQEGFQDYEEQVNWGSVGLVVAKGRYDVELVQADYKPTSEGKHMLSVQFVITDVHDANNSEFKEKRLFDNFVFTQAGGFKVKDFAAATGIELPTTVTRGVLEEWAGTVLGARATVDVAHRQWEGKNRPDIKTYHPIGGPAEVEAEASNGHHEEEPRMNGKTNGNGNGKKSALSNIKAQKNGNGKTARRPS